MKETLFIVALSLLTSSLLHGEDDTTEEQGEDDPNEPKIDFGYLIDGPRDLALQASRHKGYRKTDQALMMDLSEVREKELGLDKPPHQLVERVDYGGYVKPKYFWKDMEPIVCAICLHIDWECSETRVERDFSFQRCTFGCYVRDYPELNRTVRGCIDDQYVYRGHCGKRFFKQRLDQQLECCHQPRCNIYIPKLRTKYARWKLVAGGLRPIYRAVVDP